MHSFLTVLQVITSIIIIVSVMMQPSKSNGLSGLIAGSSETFFAKNKTKTAESVLARITAVSAVCFILTTVMLNLVK
ncbi:preprotein translocase subunit SecG [Clostridium tagluense]|uniref:Protein-export membrane protein SecG n=1 Tax=Clostridium tagluense TaxID=360422 RepID=A0A401UJV5_9CLOT|nr:MULTISPECIES: preprotein translocase subunit SecG [Clostridium]MBU3127053.1 preprotein translocase subunit SecG [Clostridium tagluense]MBW9158087.1 preprotein translocase subunit SecG [Clostridium tagluense]MBZ9625286.1 preprotein translocase subunit SecG [Clostridium sp. FP2]MCB2299923.1 preprotein translocase subunit SecG [Clostridium tagluense]MCB2311054.1 preprotein translocase subunit SecG [Clostridium tagluense]